jgi:hypothetical protein
MGVEKWGHGAFGQLIAGQEGWGQVSRMSAQALNIVGGMQGKGAIRPEQIHGSYF